ncbi:protein shisa-5-like isoform X2 [Odontomachus brunneus]|uniref:protein shisa-5-like isoform X2 n=1 Tax=Odontomachus brunneus TaxID=486640 RepID=UPI0013F1BB6F|nr:protein shisa-5-like isoform X2 [Odontomachus brunneus]
MSRLTGAFLLLCLHAGFAYGMDCSLGRSSNFLEKVVNTCPGILDSRSKSYCCYDIPNDTAYCCDAEEFALKTGLGIIVPAIITAGIVITLIVCCISCLCCSCCPWYRRRHRGTVYGIQAPNVVHVVQTPANLPPSYTSQGDQVQNHYVPYPTNPAGFPQHPPPQYNEAYAKQAPYNPAYPPQ